MTTIRFWNIANESELGNIEHAIIEEREMPRFPPDVGRDWPTYGWEAHAAAWIACRYSRERDKAQGRRWATCDTVDTDIIDIRIMDVWYRCRVEKRIEYKATKGAIL